MESFTDALNQRNLEKIRVWRIVLCVFTVDVR